MTPRTPALCLAILGLVACDASTPPPRTVASEPPLAPKATASTPVATAATATTPPAPPPVPTTPAAGPLVEPPKVDPPALSHDKIANGVTPIIPKLQGCYDDGRKTDAKLAGLVKVRFTITPTGDVTGVVDDHSTLPNNEVIKCVISLFQGLKYPPFEGKAVTSVYPIEFRAPAPSPDRVPPPVPED